MKISAIDNLIIFECDYCGMSEKVNKTLTKRSFMTKLNKFNRSHGWKCEHEFNKNTAIESSNKIIASLLEAAK